MSAHTPGPWKVWEAGSDSWEICEPLRPDRHSHFCAVRVGNFWGDEGRANARLIAAAPDLLEALRHLEGQAVQQNEAYGNPNSPSMYEALTDARAAIAKATGGQP